MTAYAAREAHTDAFITLVRSAFPTAAVLVGDGEKPAGGGWRDVPGQGTFVPYVVVYPMPSAPAESTIAAPWDDVELEWQTTITAASRRNGEIIFDLIAGVLIDVQLTVPGRAFSDHLRLTTDGGGVIREEFNQQPPLWIARPRWAITSVPE